MQEAIYLQEAAACLAQKVFSPSSDEFLAAFRPATDRRSNRMLLTWLQFDVRLDSLAATDPLMKEPEKEGPVTEMQDVTLATSEQSLGHRVSRSPRGFSGNVSFMLAGLAVLGLNKVRHEVSGYRRARPFSPADVKRSVEYDLSVVDGWLAALRRYTCGEATVSRKSVLELGPGPDLGTGLALLAQGATEYCALDVNDLASGAQEGLYDDLLARLGEDAEGEIDLAGLRSDLREALAGRPGRLSYVCRKDFDVGVFAGRGIDLVFSQAAFEHFDDPEQVVRQLGEVVRPGAVLISEVDLQTHSRWLRDSDPLNIYRYPNRVYETLHFSGSPNRWRPLDYERVLLRHGWREVSIFPGATLAETCLAGVEPFLASRFRAPSNQMDVLNFVLCATKL